jgi:hypothetical protein
MAMDIKIGGKIQLRQEQHEQRRREQAAKNWQTFRSKLAAGARLVFVLLLAATIMVFALAHEKAIQHSVEVKVARAAAHVANSAPASQIRQNTLAYEKSVDEITQ